jgi:phosphate-selective porin OprO/OprP
MPTEEKTRKRILNRRNIIGVLSVAVLSASVTTPGHAEMTVEIGGRIDAIYTYYDEDEIDMGSGSEFRRARLFAQGDIADDWKYKAQYDWAGNSTSLKDMYIRYTGWDLGNITLGQFKQEQSLEALMSAKYTAFIEKAMVTTLYPDRRIAVGFAGDSGPWHYAASLFGDQEGSDDDTSEGVGLGGRVTWGPKFGDNQFHFGGSYNWQEPGNNSWRVRSRPETHQTSTRLVDTGTLEDVDDINTYGLEAAWVLGPWSVQGEWLQQSINRQESDLPEPDLSGWYLYGSWFITGETRSYKNGLFGRTKASNAWEIAVRYSKLDLQDDGIQGGEEENWTFGVNYYVTPYLRFQLNYVAASADPVTNNIPNPDGSGTNFKDEPNAIAFRVHMDFK